VEEQGRFVKIRTRGSGGGLFIRHYRIAFRFMRAAGGGNRAGTLICVF
jgi:hypothetical protein